MVDLSFRALGMEILGRCWPVFLAGAGVHAFIAKRIGVSSRSSARSVWFIVIAVTTVAMALWFESAQATERLYATVGEGAHWNHWEEVDRLLWMAWPTVVGFIVFQLGVARRPRSDLTLSSLVVAAGVAASWSVAIWLATNVHQELVESVLLLPGGLGVVAILVGTPASEAVSVAICKWLWR